MSIDISIYLGSFIVYRVYTDSVYIQKLLYSLQDSALQNIHVLVLKATVLF